MKNWQKILSIFAVTLIVGGGYLLYVWHQRSNPGVAPPSAQTEQPLSRDEVAVVLEGEELVGVITRVDLINHLRLKR